MFKNFRNKVKQRKEKKKGLDEEPEPMDTDEPESVHNPKAQDREAMINIHNRVQW